MSTLVDKIVQAIRRDIYNGNLAPGEPLKQVELANRYGVSPIPLREALQRLQVEGLVEYFAYRGAIVARTKKSEIVDIVGIRNVLEPLAFQMALPTLDDEQLARLAALTDELESPQASDAAYFMVKIFDYYAVLLAKAQRPLLLEMIQTNLKRAIRYYAEVMRRLDGKQLPLPSRHEYLEALRKRDMNRLVTLLETRHAGYVNFIETHFKD
ncbi:GntR family transcriptional regulator [Chitinimonas sp. PSY-7]|uniref:GntR family transcriptional regulator n=1 Tax=Chitinimonas sp. PSY-7 TaxID=3459088 RepID=UPI00404021C9